MYDDSMPCSVDCVLKSMFLISRFDVIHDEHATFHVNVCPPFFFSGLFVCLFSFPPCSENKLICSTTGAAHDEEAH